jgi:hypothetical protein
LSRHSNGILVLPPELSAKVTEHFLRRHVKGFQHANQKSDSDAVIRAVDLQPGKLYDCKIDSEYAGVEDCSLVQLAIDATSNRRYVLHDARNIYKKDPEFVHKLIALDYFFLFMKEYGRSEKNSSIYEMFLDENGDLFWDESKDAYWYDFKETDVIKMSHHRECKPA